METEPAALVRDTEPRAEGVAFEAFFADHHSRLFRAMYLVTASVPDAEELMQDAFLKVWERWDRVRTMDDPVGYLYRVAMNGFRSRYRAVARAARKVMPGGSVGDPFEALDARDAVVRGLRELTPRQRAALVLTELLDYGTDEAAAVLGVKPVTVRTLSSQGRASLRKWMEAGDG